MKYIHETAPVYRWLDKSGNNQGIQNVFTRVSGADFGLGISGIGYTRADGGEQDMEILAARISENVDWASVAHLELEEIAEKLRGHYDLGRTDKNNYIFRRRHGVNLPQVDVTLIRNKLLDEATNETQEKLPELV